MLEKSIEFYRNCPLDELTEHLSKYGFRITAKEEALSENIARCIGADSFIAMQISDVLSNAIRFSYDRIEANFIEKFITTTISAPSDDEPANLLRLSGAA